MKLNILLDNADPSTWSKLLGSGIFNGITTNPTLLRKSGQPCNLTNLKHLANEAEILGCKELHFQAWGQNSQEIIDCGLALGELTTSKMKVHVKVPITKDGITAAKKIINSNISLTFTASFHTKQVLIAASLGATYIAPYMGRITDGGRDGAKEVVAMQNILKNIESPCKVLVASIRSIDEIISLALNGLNTFTISPNIAYQIFESSETMYASNLFENDARVNSNKLIK